MKLIGLLGRAQSGKTTVARMLMEEFGFVRVAFGDALKEMLIRAEMVTHEEVYGQKSDQARWLMQRIGTEIFRKQIDPLFWVKKAQERITKQRSNGFHVVVDDVRFPEEARAIQILEGKVVKLERTDFVDERAGVKHDSERLVESIEADYVIRVETGVEKLVATARELFQSMGIVPKEVA